MNKTNNNLLHLCHYRPLILCLIAHGQVYSCGNVFIYLLLFCFVFAFLHGTSRHKPFLAMKSMFLQRLVL